MKSQLDVISSEFDKQRKQKSICLELGSYNQMNKEKTKKSNKGPGFGDALFAMKNMQMDYEAINDAPMVPAPIKPIVTQPKKNTMTVNQPKKPNPVKPQIGSKPTIMKQKEQSVIFKEEFKIAPGKQFQNHVNFSMLRCLVCTKGVFELSQNNVRSAWEYNVFCDGIPANQIVEKPEITFNFNAQDLKQGSLGNCYFIASLSALADHPEILRSRIPNFKEYGGETKSFKVNLFESGKNIEMIVDNLFPKLYCKPVLNDISPMVLEKAYAQSYGNFEVVNMGHACDSLRDLSGATTVYLDLKNKEDFRTKIKAAFLSKYGVVIASKKEHVHPDISPKHSYNVLSYENIKGNVYLLLRDPRGWTKADFKVPHPLTNTAEMGMFWVDQKVLEQNFQVITICKVMKNYQYFYKAFGQKELTHNRGGLLMTLHRPMKVFLSIHQKHKKFFDDKFSYDIIKLMIAEVSVQKNSFEVIQTIKSDFNAQQVCSFEVELKPKSYILLGQIGKKKGKDLFPKQFFTLSVYSESDEIQFSQISGSIDPKPFLISYIRNNKEEFKQSSTEQGLYRYQGPLFGYICMYYENRGKKKVLEEIEYTVKNIEISEKRIQMGPNSSKLVIHAIRSQNNCSHQCSMKSKTLYS